MPMQIVVNNLMGKTVCYDVTSNEPVISVMEKVGLKEGLAVGSLRLMYSGKQLNPERLLSTYGITNNASMHLAPCSAISVARVLAMAGCIGAARVCRGVLPLA